MRIAILNYADVANFGDVFFPFIAEHELRSRLGDVEIAFFSPTAHRLGTFRSDRYDRDVLATYDAVLLCGGEIVHREDEMLSRIYERLGTQGIERPTDLVFGWTDLPVRFKAWIGLGMPPPSARVSHDVAQATAHLDLVVARGEGTRARMLASGVPPDRLETSADLGWLIPRISSQHVPDAEAATYGRPYVVVHAMPQLETPGALDAAAAGLKAVQRRHGVDVICLPLTTCWGDHETLDRLAALAGGTFRVIDHRLDIFTKATVLKNCAFYVGQSMHGFITALAAGRPAGLCYPDLDDKFRELLAYLDGAEWRMDHWSGLESLVERITSVPVAGLLARQARAVAAVDEMFDRLAARLRAAIEKE